MMTRLDKVLEMIQSEEIRRDIEKFLVGARCPGHYEALGEPNVIYFRKGCIDHKRREDLCRVCWNSEIEEERQ